MMDDSGAVVFLSDMNSNSLIETSTFVKNRALKEGGGAIRLNQAAKVTFRGNTFTENVSEGVDSSTNDAGAIYFQCDPRIKQEECEVILKSNLFERNSAKNKGGALRYVNTNFTTEYEHSEHGGRILSARALQDGQFVDTNVYIDNRAAQGNDLASYGSSFTYEFIQNGKALTSTDELEYAPGQTILLRISILDQEGRLFSDDSEISCIVNFSGEYDDNRSIINSEAVATNGIISWDTLILRQLPDSSA